MAVQLICDTFIYFSSININSQPSTSNRMGFEFSIADENGIKIFNFGFISCKLRKIYLESENFAVSRPQTVSDKKRGAKS